MACVVGKFGDDVAARDVINDGGLWGNTAHEAIFFIGLTDSDKQPLSGSKTYEIRFPKGGLPGVSIHWRASALKSQVSRSAVPSGPTRSARPFPVRELSV